MIEQCVSDVKRFMDRNFLKQNQDKTEIILFGSDFNVRKQPTATLRIGDHAILSQSEVRNLGAIFDSTLSMVKFVLNKCKNVMFYLRSIYRIQKKPGCRLYQNHSQCHGNLKNIFRH